ncbi:unnamed protein product [Cylindrotheca closterium]|uniref:PPIase cyclophilin-type domain-containing protein n=1 Tax=Cylindrotheca closterium TaxID=2856 RepID=A0AAD2G5D8_9STRA|nr:unnamed protein product [Cylindrotheca closterium]
MAQLLLPSLLQTLDPMPSSTLVSSSSTATSSSSSSSLSPSSTDIVAEVTNKVFFDIRIARQDGSTYVRDDLPDTFENRVISARITMGLFGKQAPNHVEKFLSYVLPPKDTDVDNPYPAFSRSSFTSLNQETGLLAGGYIPSLRVSDIGGSTALTYGSRVLPAPLWIEKSSPSITTTKLSHNAKGLLTHKTLDVTPTFGITTRPEPSLDATHTIFGQVLWDDSTVSLFRDFEDIPTYALERPAGYDDFNTGGLATSVYNAQKDFFRGAAKSFGDTRVSKLYEGKLLRRVEVLQAGIIQ